MARREKRIEELAIAYAALSPTILHPQWMDVPERILERARLSRIRDALCCVKEEKATLEDALAYMYSASMVAPMVREGYEIYFFLVAKIFPQFRDYMKRAGIPFIEQLSPEAQQMLDDLRRWIFKQQIKVVRQRLKKLYGGSRSHAQRTRQQKSLTA